MQSSLLNDALPDASALALSAALRGTPGHYDELLGRPTDAPAVVSAGTTPADGPGPLWKHFFDVAGAQGWLDFNARQGRVRRRVAEDGVSFNVYEEQSEGTRTWPLELLPFLIGPDEWVRIEHGVLQRARMLEAVMADLYGPRELLHQGLLPSALVLGHPQYLRPMHGATPCGGRWLHVVGVDVARGPDGHWWVVGHRAQAPSGLGYMLENRLIIKQEFADEFRSLRVQRMAVGFQALMEGLARSSPMGARARIALLTPGPHNETYFEQVFLARYLGLTLVEGSDLTVRDSRLYLKTMHGLERVHILLRRVDDEWLDPLELRSDSALGVPGLLEAVRAGEVVVANAPGAGVLESPGLAAFWPGVARHTLGENLMLPATTSWWCGEAAVWKTLRPRLGEFIVAPTFPGGGVTQDFVPVAADELDAAQRARLAERIDADPAAYTLLARVRPSELPVWSRGRLEPRPAVVRLYAIANAAGGWQVVPGGFTRVAQTRSAGTDSFLSMQRGSASVDTWVLTDGEVDQTTLLPRPLAPSELVSWHRVVTSRSAENMFWLGRYTERAENCVQVARLALDAHSSAGAEVLGALHALAIRHGLIETSVPSPAHPSPNAARVFERALVRSLADAGEAGSVAFNLGALQTCAMALRERLSPGHWALIQSVTDEFSTQMRALTAHRDTGPAVGDVLTLLNRVSTQLMAITGAQTDHMTRDDGWRLLSVGRMIERLDTLAHALTLGVERGLHTREDGFALLLDLFDSTITYRAHFQSRREVLPLVHLLVLDTDNPRSLAWVARTVRERLRKLARHDPVWADSVCAELAAPDRWSLEALGLEDGGRDPAALIAALRDCSESARMTSDAISRHLFAHVGATLQSVWQ